MTHAFHPVVKRLQRGDHETVISAYRNGEFISKTNSFPKGQCKHRQFLYLVFVSRLSRSSVSLTLSGLVWPVKGVDGGARRGTPTPGVSAARKSFKL